ncbi:MAG: tripartite tricarboxylate transporter substrate binding protein [Kiloniellaceae bacterium]
MLKRLIPSVLAVGLLVGPSAVASAGTLAKPGGFPERPLTLIVPYGAGGGSDQLSRAMAAALEQVVGVGVQVVNKPGGGGMAAVPDFMAAPADGYTIIESIDDAISNHASGKLKENPAVDWVPLAMAQITFSQIYVRPDDDRLSDWESFVAYAKANPGQVKIANVGNLGSMERVNMLKIEQALGFKTNQIAFDKPAERYAALLGGHVDALFEQPGDVRSFLDSGKMKPILTLFGNRPDAFSEVPTLAEVGVNVEPLLRFRGFWTLPGVPAERREYLEAAFREAFNSAEFQAFNRKKYMHLIDSYRDTEGSRKLIEGAIETYKAVYREIGIIK